MNNAVFGNTKEKVRKHRDINFITAEVRRHYLMPKPNYQRKKIY